MRDYKIDEEFEHNGKRYVVVEHDPLWTCFNCAFASAKKGEDYLLCITKELACTAKERQDKRDVYFEEIKR